MYKTTEFIANIFTIIAAWYAIRRWFPPKWWLRVGYWVNAQAWGARDAYPSIHRSSCWIRVLPRPVCWGLARLFLWDARPDPREARPDPTEDVRALIERKLAEANAVADAWWRITQRHERKSPWGRHPHGCTNPLDQRPTPIENVLGKPLYGIEHRQEDSADTPSRY